MMDGLNASESIDHHRRHFFGTAALTVAAAQFGVIGAAQAQSNVPITRVINSTTPFRKVSAIKRK